VVLVKTRRRTGISELLAAVITIAITLIAGAALFGFVNGEAANSENNLGNANAQNVNFLNEKFTVVNLAIQASGNTAYIWIYNNGNLALQLGQIAFYPFNEADRLSFDTVFNNINGAGNTGCISPTGNGTATSTATGEPFVFGYGGTQIQNESSPFEITLTLAPNCQFAPGTTYEASVVGLYGNIVVYPECDSSLRCTT
jgi:flagellin-like protein